MQTVELKLLAGNVRATIRNENRVINGAFNINQRGVSGTVTLAAGVYGNDRWKAGASGCTYTFASANGVTTLTITSGTLLQTIEGVNVPGGAVIMSWSGTAQGRIGGGSYSTSGVTGVATAGSNLNIEFGTGTLTTVQLEDGAVVTPFAFRHASVELTLCQRYYYKASSHPLGVTLNASDGYAPIVKFPVTMRATPTLDSGASFSVGSGSAGVVQLSTVNADAALLRNSSSNWTANQSLTLVAAGFNAEL